VLRQPGNHDDRAAFRRHLLRAGAGQDDVRPVNQTYWRGGLRVIALDSTVPGEAGGALDDATLAYLRAELTVPAPDGTILALHHPPVASPIEPAAAIALRDPGQLGAAIAGSDVRIVLCGHYHHEALGMLGATPVWVGPAVAYRAQATSTRVFRRVPGAAFSRVDLPAGGPPLVTVIPVNAVGRG
jgi:3',5'-cyclic-AMP phosphodiesterase